MKKLSFFLMAMLMSIMGFAADYSATNTSNVSFTIGTKAYDNKIKIEGTEYQAIKLGTTKEVGDMSFTIPANTAKIHLHIVGWSGKSSAVTISASNGVTLGTTEITATSDAGMTGNSPFTLSDVSKVTTDYYHVIELSSPTTAETTITMKSVSGKYRVVIWGVNTEEATSGEQGETVDTPTFSATEANFTEAFNLTITSAEGTTLKYTTDKTDPTTSETAVAVESNTATVSIPAKSTMVKAVAVKGELVSNVKSMTFCYVNSEATAYTVTEALAIYNEGLGLSNKLYIKGSVKNIEDLSTEYGNATYTITDGENDLYIYRGKNFGGEKFTSADQLFVGDDLVLYGQLTSYNGNPQMAANNEIISRESKTKSIVAEDLTFEAIAKGAEVKAQTLTVIGANLTAEITATLDNENFTVTPATLPAAGGDLTITPAADLAAGEHTATLTLTSGDVTKEVALSILVKDVYAIEWYVNGKLYEETTVIEGAALALPEAPEAPEACSEKVFVGWTAAEEVNADGSEIEWATAATVPTTDTTYYAVFAVQEGEGGAAEEGTVTLAYTGTTTGNMDLEANNAAAVGLDETKWNVIATKGDNSNAPGLNKSGDIRIYYGDPTSNTITVTSLDETVTISTIVITYTGDTYSNGKILVNDAVVTGTNGTYEIKANSFTITNGNTSNIQVRLKNIVINYTAGAAATYSEYSTVCESDVVEPTTITWELNGGELPAVVVPTNAELWETFKPYYNEYYGLTRADQPIDKVSTFAAAKMQEIMTDEASEYKWLGDYVQSVATAAGVPLSTDMAAANESGWRWAVHAFFNAAAGQYGAAGIDFTEAGKPEAWSAAYEAEYGVVLPTEPVEEDYVLPTPTKTGYDFVGWYDNAEGTGEAMTVLPAGWVGTLYAIWKESSTTGVDNNIIAEQAVKVIRNGQVLIMIGEKTFNIMGQQVK